LGRLIHLINGRFLSVKQQYGRQILTIHSAPAAAKIESNSRAKAGTSEEPQRPNELNILTYQAAFQTSAIWHKQRPEASNQSLLHVPAPLGIISPGPTASCCWRANGIQ
jgi:hypothetical protein